MDCFDHTEVFDSLSVSDRLTGTTFSPESDSKQYGATTSEFGDEPVYDLRSDRFYADVAAFSAKVVAEIERRAAAALDGYGAYVADKLHEAPRTRGEYALELLTVGMTLRLYGEVAFRTPLWVIDVARELFWLRRRTPSVKPAIDFCRAGLFQVFMRKRMETRRRNGRDRWTASAGFSNLPRLVNWLQATGEFEQESCRLDNWRSYLDDVPRLKAEDCVGISLSLFDWFTHEAETAMGKYTAGVIRFLEKTYAVRFWREDQIFCGKQPVEYHMGMVAAEVMNDGLREGFHRKPRKVLLVPTCLRGARRAECKAVVRGLDMTCAGCDPDCAVNRITRRMRDEQVRVFMVPHATGFSRWLERWQDDPKVGVAAVACLMNILPGGYEMRARRMVSQCVPLDYPGCRKHWTNEGVPTSVNEERLVQIMKRSEK